MAGTEEEAFGETASGVEVGAEAAGGVGNGAGVVEGDSGDGTANGEEVGAVAGRSGGVSGEGGVGSLGLEEGAGAGGGAMTASLD